MSGKTPINELIRLALIFAVQDREAMADACHNGPDRDEALALAKEFRAYHRKRFGSQHMTAFDAALANASTIGLDDLRKMANPTTPKGAASDV